MTLDTSLLNTQQYKVRIKGKVVALDNRHQLYFICFKTGSWLMGRVFANGPGNLSSISGRVVPKTLKMVLNTSLLNTKQFKVRIKCKMEQSRDKSSALPYTSV